MGLCNRNATNGHVEFLKFQTEIFVEWKAPFISPKTCEKDVVGIVTFDLIGLLATNHIIAYNYFNGIQEFIRKCSMLIK